MKKRILLSAVLVMANGLSVMASEGPKIQGTIDANGVKQTIHSALNPLKQCYETQLKTNNSLKGKVALQMEVNDKGRVQSAGIQTSSTLKDKKIHECMLNVVKDLSFPQPAKGTVAVVDYPLDFSPKSGVTETKKK